MQPISGPVWYARELAQLQDEIARLHRLLEGIAPLSEPHEETSRTSGRAGPRRARRLLNGRKRK